MAQEWAVYRNASRGEVTGEDQSSVHLHQTMTDNFDKFVGQISTGRCGIEMFTIYHLPSASEQCFSS